MEKFVIGAYFRTNQFSSFLRQLYLYGWRKLKDEHGSYYHHFFHRDMCVKDSLQHFTRGALPTTETSIQSTPKNLPFVKRAAFNNACSGIKSAFKTKDPTWEGSDPGSELAMSGDDGAATAGMTLASPKKKRGRPKAPLRPKEHTKKKRPGRPKKQSSFMTTELNAATKRKGDAIESVTSDRPPLKRRRYTPKKLRCQAAATPVSADRTDSLSESIQVKDQTSSFQIGDSVEARYRGISFEYYPGVISAVHGSHYDIKYNDGDKDEGLSSDFIRFPLNIAGSVAPDVVQSSTEGTQSTNALEKNHQVSTVSPAIETIIQPVDNHIFGCGLGANVDDWYDALWLSKADEIFAVPNPPNITSDLEVAPTSSDATEAPDNVNHESTTTSSNETQCILNSEVGVPSSVNIQSPILANRLSFMPVDNKYPARYFSPIHPQSFALPDSEKEEPAFELTSAGFTTPSKEDCRPSLIEFSWKSSTASYSVDHAAVAAKLPSLDVGSFAIHPSEDINELEPTP